ncbi:MAG: peptidylprolyl isomerase [Bacteroidota bacterium]
MKAVLKIICVTTAILVFAGCEKKTSASKTVVEKRKAIEMVTSYGTIVMELYNKTPLHRDNFIKLVDEKAYDSLLFHRVIQNFVIQAGDPKSKYAQAQDTIGGGGLSYTVKAEIDTTLFHKKGVLASARDQRLDRASDGIQFYLVQGKIYNDSLLSIAETRINTFLAEHYMRNDPAYSSILDRIDKALEISEENLNTLYKDSLDGLIEAYDNFERYTIPESHRSVYKSIGGTPHLDQSYTVFGEVVKGLEVIDSIATVQVGDKYRPLSEVRIQSMRILEY